MKSFIEKVFVFNLIAIVVVFSSCSSSSDKLLNHIPDNAFAVAVFNMSKLLKATDLSALEKNNEFKEMKEELEHDYEEMVNLVESIFKNPNKSGIKLNDDICCFYFIVDEKPIMGLLAGVNKKDLEKNLEIASKELGFNPADIFREKDGMQYFDEEHGSFIAYDKNKILLLLDDSWYYKQSDLFSVAESIFAGNKKNSIRKNKDFSNFMSNKKDINLWVSSSYVDNDKELRELMKEFRYLTGIDYKDNFGHLHVEVRKNEILLTQKLRYNESVSKMDVSKIIENIEDIYMFLNDPVRYMRNIR